jgi:hypothetical protein
VSHSDDAGSARKIKDSVWEGRRRAEDDAGVQEQQLKEDLDQQLDTFKSQLDALGKRYAKGLEAEKQEALQRAEKEQREILRAIGGEVDKRVTEIKTQTSMLIKKVTQEGAKQRGSLESAHKKRRQQQDPSPVHPAGATGRNRWLIPAVLLLGLLLGLAGPKLVGFFSGGEDSANQPSLSTDPATPVAADREAIHSQWVETLKQPGKAFSEIQRHFQGDGREQDLTAAAYLALKLRVTPALSATSSCALMQAALGITVDGGCGAGTQGSLKKAFAAAAAPVCEGTTYGPRRLCFLEHQLDVAREGCGLAWPLQRTCGWDLSEAQKLLSLVRKTVQLTKNTTLQEELKPYDLAKYPEAFDELDRWTIRDQDLNFLIEISYLVARPQASWKPAVQMTAEELDAAKKAVSLGL